MYFNVLGPLEILGVAGPLSVNGRRRRALLAVLLFHPRRAVSIQSLVDGIWGDDPPGSAIQNIRTYVYDIRRMLCGHGDSAARLASHPIGYLLDVRPDEMDLLRFEELTRDGREAARRGDHPRAADRLGQALDLWRGRPIEDLATIGTLLPAAIAFLEEQRWLVASTWVDAQLALQRYGEVLPRLRTMVAERPLDERFRRQLIVALHGAGRTADALSAYRAARHTIVEELGVEPGAELQRAHAAVLR